MKRLLIVLTAAVVFSAFQSKPQKGMIWADCTIYETFATPTSFKGNGPYDELYVTPTSFQSGIFAISESKPGDTDYNGGRWHVNMLRSDVDPDKYANACSVNDLNIGEFMPTSTYFVCPLLPVR